MFWKKLVKKIKKYLYVKYRRNKDKKKFFYQLKKFSNKKERAKLEITLATYISILDNSGTIRYTNFIIGWTN